METPGKTVSSQTQCEGIGLGVLASYLITTYRNLTPLISPLAIIVSFSSASMVGIIFGLYPAWKAANQNTIDALRYE